MRIGLSELLLIIVLVLILFGAGKFPKIMENFAEGIKVFKKSMNENDDETKGKNKKSSPTKATVPSKRKTVKSSRTKSKITK